MEKAIENAINSMAKKSEDSTDANDAMKYSQSTLNVTNALVSIRLNVK